MFSGVKEIALLLLFVIIAVWFFASGLFWKLVWWILMLKNHIWNLVYFFWNSSDGLYFSIIAWLIWVLLFVIIYNSWKPN
jgi:hypothetical protein